jgi:hypothetical protein
MAAIDLVPESTLPYPPIYTDKKFVVLSDWYNALLGGHNIDSTALQGWYDHYV